MKEIEFFAGQTIDRAYQMLQEQGEPCFGMFNDKKICSTDTIDQAYVKVLGTSKYEFEERKRREQEAAEQNEAKFKAAIPYLTDKYRSRARGVIPEEHLEEWDRIVPIRLNDLYHGMELDCWLELVSELNHADCGEEGCFKACKDMFYKQGHSGMSAVLVFSGLKRFHPLGNELVEYINKHL